jgi:hypothetical protein
MSLRLPQADREWLFAHAAETGSAVNAIIVRAVAEYREHVQSEQMQSANIVDANAHAVSAEGTCADA